MSDYLIIRHKVRDFASWKTAFDAHAPVRADAGLTDKLLLRSADDPNEVVILCGSKDLARARAFAASSNLREVMQKAGVTGTPDLLFLSE